MQKENQLFEDFARLLSSVAGTVAGAGREAETRIRERLREAALGLDFVSREEFEAARTLAANARAEASRMAAELQDLRAEVADLRAEVKALKATSGASA